MAAQGTSSQPSQAGSIAKTVPAAQKTTPATTAVAKKELTKDLLEKAIKEEKNLKDIATETGNSIHDVKEALKANGLKTASMGEGAGRLSFGDLNAIYMAVLSGCGNIEAIVQMTGLNTVIVKAGVRKLKKDGELVDSIAVAKKPATAATQQ